MQLSGPASQMHVYHSVKLLSSLVGTHVLWRCTDRWFRYYSMSRMVRIQIRPYSSLNHVYVWSPIRCLKRVESGFHFNTYILRAGIWIGSGLHVQLYEPWCLIITLCQRRYSRLVSNPKYCSFPVPWIFRSYYCHEEFSKTFNEKDIKVILQTHRSVLGWMFRGLHSYESKTISSSDLPSSTFHNTHEPGIDYLHHATGSC